MRIDRLLRHLQSETPAAPATRNRPRPRYAAAAIVLLAGVMSIGLGDPPRAGAAEPEVSWAEEDASQDSVLVRFEESSRSGRAGRGGRWVRVPVDPKGDPADAIKQLGLTPARAEVAPEFDYREMEVPNDPRYVDQWHLTKIGMETVWGDVDGSGVTVAVLDSGVATGGSDLVCTTFAHPYNAFTHSTDLAASSDDSGHGTHVIGTVAQCTNNDVGAAGIAPGATIMPIKVLEGGGGTSAEVANGIMWAVDHGADIINLSLGRSCSSAWPACADVAVDSAIQYARDLGVLVVAAAGNDGSPWVSSPANHPAAFAVGATTPIDTLASYSNYGDAIDLVAPGGNSGDLDGNLRPDEIFQESFDSNGWGVVAQQGTSSAAPHVAGTAALVLSVNPSLTVAELEAILASTAVDLDPSGWDSKYGAGRVDTAAAVLAAQPLPSTTAAYILGGTTAVSSTVEADAAAIVGASPTRLAGSDRYATAAAISEQAHPTGAETVYVVTGETFPDALGVGPVAAIDGAPVLLVTRSGVPDPTRVELQRLSPSRVIVVGGTAAIADSVANQLNALTAAPVTRIAGSDRFATAVAVSRSSFSTGVDAVLLVTGRAYPDGLAAGPVATLLGGPVLLTGGSSLPPVTRGELLRLAPQTVIIAGGTSAVQASVEASIRGLGLDVVRIAGADRYSTAAGLSNGFFGSGTRPVFVATGEAFPDALSGAAAAGQLGSPVLLTRRDVLPGATLQELDRYFP